MNILSMIRKLRVIMPFVFVIIISQQSHSQSDAHRVFNDEFRELMIDKNNLWFDTYNYPNYEKVLIGRYNLNEDKVDFFTNENTHIPITKEHIGNINDIKKDNIGNIWFATSGGLLKYDGKSWTLIDKYNSQLPGNSTYSILFENDNMWISMMDEGVVKINNNEIEHFKNELCGKSVFSIEKVKQDFYFACWGGISKFDGFNWTNFTNESACSFDVVQDVKFDSKGNMWIGGGKGNPALAKYDGKEWTVYNELNSPISCRYVSSIFIENDTTLWFGTSGSGLIKFNVNSEVFTSVGVNFEFGWIYDIQQDGKGNLWFGTEKGLYKYDKKEFYKITSSGLGLMKINDYYEFFLCNNEITITRYIGDNSSVEISKTIDGYPVIAICNKSFSYKDLTSITIPNSITTIGADAFRGNRLTSITIPNSVTTIGAGAFSGNKLSSVSIPNSVKTIGAGAFSRNKLTSVTIPNSVTGIDEYTFIGNQLTSVIIPNSVTTIGSDAFSGNQLKSLIIPNSVTFIGRSAFSQNQLTSVIIPNSVTTIDASAFEWNRLSSVSIPNSVKTIGKKAFSFNQLTSVIIPNSVKTIGAGAFNLNAITQINNEPTKGLIFARRNDGTIDNTIIVSYGGASNTIDFIPNSVITIGESAFNCNNYRGKKLTSVIIPNSVTTIGAGAFSGNKLNSITIPNSVTSIGRGAFPNARLPLPIKAGFRFIKWQDSKGNEYPADVEVSNLNESYEALFKKKISIRNIIHKLFSHNRL